MASPTPSPFDLNATSSAPDIWQIMLVILYLALIMVGVYYATRFFASLYQRSLTAPGKRKLPGRSIFLVDRLAFDRDKSIMLIEEGEKRYLLGVTPGGITLLKEYSAPPQEQGEQISAPGFSDILKNFKKQFSGDN